MNNLKHYRKLASMSQEYLGRRMGVSMGCIRAWENDVWHPTEYQIQRMADLLGCTFEDLDLIPSERRGSSGRHRKYYEPTANTVKLNKLINEANELGRPCLREILAYLGPESERHLIRRLYEGVVSDDDMDMMRRVIEKHRGRIE